MTQDFVSCLCASRGCISYLKNAVAAFDWQTHPHRELIVAYAENDDAVEQFLQSLLSRVIPLPVPAGTSLGHVRNMMLRVVRGDYLCIWDDDDWFHPDRLSAQLDSARSVGKLGSILVKVILYDTLAHNAYLSFSRPWDGSLLVRTDIVMENNVRYPDKNTSEDVDLTNQLLRLNVLAPLIRPELYIYNFTGSNTSSNLHFRKLFELSQKLPQPATDVIREAITGWKGDASVLNMFGLVEQSFDYFFDYSRRRGIV